MARITWLGEGDASPPTVTWFGRELRAGEAVEIEDARLIAKAKGSRFFKVEEVVPVTQWREPATEADPADEEEDEDEEEPHPAPHRPAAKPKHRAVKHR